MSLTRAEGKQDDGRKAALAGLLQSGLLKPFESSAWAALWRTWSAMVAVHDAVLKAMEEEHGVVPLTDYR